MSYKFINANNNFMRCSTVYNVYDNDDMPITSIVVGYETAHNIFYFTEYRGGDRSYNMDGIQNTEELANILYDFSQLFEYMEYPDIFSNMSIYEDYKDIIPKITKDKLYVYDGNGIVKYGHGEWFLEADDEYVNDLLELDILEKHMFLLEDTNNDDDLFVDLESDPFYCNGDEIDGFYLYVKDWNKLEVFVLANNN
jgi:hypothetical protein